MANRLVKRNVAAAKKTKNVGEASGKDSQEIEEPKAKCTKVDVVPEKKIPEKKGPQLKLKGSTLTVPPSGDREKGKKVIGTSLPTSKMTEEEVRHHLVVQRRRVFGGKTEEEMTEYLNTMTDWCMGGAMLAQFFVGAVRDLAVLPTLKKNFHQVAAKLEVDELKLQSALGQVKLLTDERDKLSTSVSELSLQKHTLTIEKQKALDDAKVAADEAKAVTTELELLRKEIRDLKKEKNEEEIKTLRILWEESAGVYFHTAIKQMKFLNPGVELKTWGMSTLCLVENGKWYHAQPGGNVECEPGDE
ncbi:hypothetical protein SESBI_31786 [Sesbania bispinosa]|nr:hypothetical protein SESBI_31786 [Sesbania bispinosa]